MIPSLAACSLSLAACVTDLKWRRIPNVLTFGGAAGALVFHTVTGGAAGFERSLAGWLVGIVLFLPIFVLRGIGGGDIKLLAALGAWVGLGATVWLALWTAIAGGVFALIVAALHRYTGQAFRNLWGMLSYWRVMGWRPHPGMTLETSAGPKLPYSIPIAAGLGLTLWLA